MTITLKRTNRKIVVTIDGNSQTFTTLKGAWNFIYNRSLIGYADQKYRVMKQLQMLPRDRRTKLLVKKWLRSYSSEVSMDNAVRDIITGKCTLEDALIRKGYMQ
jgi:ribosomal protein RSM22 (predicted rRNA methylase)